MCVAHKGHLVTITTVISRSLESWRFALISFMVGLFSSERRRTLCLSVLAVSPASLLAPRRCQTEGLLCSSRCQSGLTAESRETSDPHTLASRIPGRGSVFHRPSKKGGRKKVISKAAILGSLPFQQSVL